MLIDVGDTRLHVTERGGGDLALFVLHGGPGLDHTMFGSYLDALGDRCRLLLVDDKAAIMAKLGSTEARISLGQPLAALPPAFAAYPVSLENDGRTLVYRGGDGSGKGKREAAEVIKALVDHGIAFEGIDTRESSLEDIFVDLVERGERRKVALRADDAPVRVLDLGPALAQLAQEQHDRSEDVGRLEAGDDDRPAVLGRDLHRRVLAARGRAADQERQPDLPPLHLPRHRDHLVERGRDEAAQPDQVHALLGGRPQDDVLVHHHPEVDHLVVVAPEHDADDVLADVVDVAFDGGEDDFALR